MGELTGAVPTLPWHSTPELSTHHPVITDTPIPEPAKSLTGFYFLAVINRNR